MAEKQVKEIEAQASLLLDRLKPLKTLEENLSRNLSEIKELISQARKQAASVSTIAADLTGFTFTFNTEVAWDYEHAIYLQAMWMFWDLTEVIDHWLILKSLLAGLLVYFTVLASRFLYHLWVILNNKALIYFLFPFVPY